MNNNSSSGHPQAAVRRRLPECDGVMISFHAYLQNEEIYGEGEDVCYWYKVVSGTVRTCNLLADGRRHIAEFFFPDDFFGFSAEDRYLTSAEAVSKVVLARYPYAALEHLSRTNPSLALHLHGIATKTLVDMSARMVLLSRKTAHERVASFLLGIADHNNSSCRVELPMTRHDIADHLGLTYETVCRILSSLKRSGAIKVLADVHQIEIIDGPALEAMQAGRPLCGLFAEPDIRLRELA
jgi:CRP/FNR family nitrogen fixation transcriptional regulator